MLLSSGPTPKNGVPERGNQIIQFQLNEKFKKGEIIGN
jgi:hypothetical protein